jgi:predicted GNAT family acetyltransferase
VTRVVDNPGRVVPLCPFISRYLSHHPEYADLLARR